MSLSIFFCSCANDMGYRQMYIDNLFEQRSLIAYNLRNCIRDRGYTKISFANKMETEKVF